MVRRKRFTPHEDEALIFGHASRHNRKEMAQVLHCTTRQISKRLNKLKDKGLIVDKEV